ncbi:hypothetical protein ACPF8X_03240 [Streptomyces sp. G35A]
MDTTDARAQQLIDAVNEALAVPTAHRDDTPVPTVGDTPPVAQPGRPPMSQRATDASVMMLSAGAASLPIGGMTSLVIYTLGSANPVSLAIGAAAPAALAVPIFALARLVKRAKTPVHHHHYNGAVDQRTVNATALGLYAKNQVKGTR